MENAWGPAQAPLIGEFCEVESGRRSDPPQLAAAIAAAKKAKATLIIAKLDRLARNVHFISGLMESGVDFVAADNPHANKLMVHMLAAFAEHEREQISRRTKDAPAAAKARGIKFGRYFAERLAPAYREAAVKRARQLAPLLAEFKKRWNVDTANGSRIDGARHSNSEWRQVAWADRAADD